MLVSTTEGMISGELTSGKELEDVHPGNTALHRIPSSLKRHAVLFVTPTWNSVIRGEIWNLEKDILLIRA